MLEPFYHAWNNQWPPAPHFTEKDLPSLEGKVYVVTGANTGVGKQLAQMLYSRSAKIYVAARSEDKALAAIEDIKKAEPSSKGQLVFLPLDLADLSTIKASAQRVLDAESKLHVLFNNAGVMHPPPGAVSAQGYELQLGVNCLGHFLFTKLLTPLLVAAAKTEPASSVRVVWVSSSAAELPWVPTGGVPMDQLDDRLVKKSHMAKYGISKAGNYLHSAEYARQHKADGVVSVALNPGNLQSDLWRHHLAPAQLFLNTFILHPTKNGAYTELFAGLSPEVTLEKTGGWIIPWGRFYDVRKDLADAARSEEEGGTGIAKQFWDWSEEQTKAFS